MPADLNALSGWLQMHKKQRRKHLAFSRVAGFCCLPTLCISLSACNGWQDQDGDGYRVRDGDCADNDSAIHPGVSEVCDGKDEDCDGLVDESDVVNDFDGDGFSPELTSNCTTADYALLQQGDCNDAAEDVHPGASDASGDGVDSDCGGHDDADPHVGLDGDDEDLSTALASATDGTIVWVGSGSFGHDGKSLPVMHLEIRGTRPGEESVIVAKLEGRPLNIAAGEGSTLVLRDLKFSDSSGDLGASIKVQGATLSIQDCVFTGSSASTEGGAISVSGSVVDIENSRFEENSASKRGGALAARDSELHLTDVSFRSNRASEDGAEGGALWVSGGSLTATRLTLIDNSAAGNGGGIALNQSDAFLENVIAQTNEGGNFGGAFYVLDPVHFELTQASVLSNIGASGGGVALALTPSTDASSMAETVLLKQASSTGLSPKMASFKTLEKAPSASNTRHSDAASASPQFVIHNSLLAYNSNYNILLEAGDSDALSLTWSDLYSIGGQSHNLLELDDSVLNAAPGLIRFVNDDSADNDDMHPGPNSVLKQSGDPLVENPEGSRSDIGAYGGPNANRLFYLDEDMDGLYDGWELSFSNRLATRTGLDDGDHDGATALQELQTGCDPSLPDTDGDGITDGDELKASSDPTDWYSQPGQSYPVSAIVGSAAGELQEQLRRIQFKGKIVLPVGTMTGGHLIRNKDLELMGQSTPAETILSGDGEAILTAVQSKLKLSGMTLTGGRGHAGGALALTNVDAALVQVNFSNNSLEAPLEVPGGGGIYHKAGTLSLEQCTFEGQLSEATGGAVYTEDVALEVKDTRFQNCRAEDSGGAIQLVDSTLSVSNVTFTGNSAGMRGGALMTSGSTLDLTDLQVLNGSVDGIEGSGGGFYLFDSHVEINNGYFKQLSANEGGAIVADNSELTASALWIERGMATTAGGGIAVNNHAVARLTNLVIESSEAGTEGGGLRIDCAEAYLQNATLVSSRAEVGGGVYIADAANPACPSLLFQSLNAVIAFNDDYNLFAEDPRRISTTYSDYWNVEGHFNHNLPLLVSTNWAQDPLFQSMGVDGYPSDLHLSMTSPLIDQGLSSLPDADKSVSDPGAYGGALGGTFDKDLDSFGEYFWPGTYADVPATVNAYRYDCDDLTSDVQNCQ